jgi:hypothetical protein
LDDWLESQSNKLKVEDLGVERVGENLLRIIFGGSAQAVSALGARDEDAHARLELQI